LKVDLTRRPDVGGLVRFSTHLNLPSCWGTPSRPNRCTPEENVMKGSKLLLLGWLMAFCCAILTPALQAQYRGSLRGTVSDPSGAVISDATVTLVNKQTNSTMTSTSDKN